MRSQTLIGLILVSIAAASPVSHAQQAASPALSLEDIAERIADSEAGVTARVRAYRPLIEVYMQTLETDEQLGTIPTHDEYFLGQFDWNDSEGPQVQPLSPPKGSLRQKTSVLAHPFSVQYLPDGFAAMTVPDWRVLNAKRYEFAYVKREFLGEARCLVFDVRPRGDGRDGFTGRIWVEDRGYNIVRFNGINRSVDQKLTSFFKKKASFHVDSWRVNALPGFWLPAYVYCEETDPSDKQALPRMPKIKAQIRIWGYESKGAPPQQQFTAIQIDEPTVRDNADPPQQLSPVLSQRRWEQEAEDNVIDRLTKAGLLARPGGVDKILETVVNNLAVTNNLSVEPVHCRVLLTSPFESLTVGHTIILSRGLIDVLPDEASLAMMLAHELGHVVLGHQLIDTKFAFADRLMVPDGEVLARLRFRHTPKEEAAADAKVIELLKNSPYKDKLSDSGLFLRAIAAHVKQLPNLIQAHMGDHIADGDQVLRLTELMQQAPPVAPERLDQTAALPLGARLVVDPWSGRIDLVRAAAVPLQSAREKMPFAVTPLMPYVKYAESMTPTSASLK